MRKTWSDPKKNSMNRAQWDKLNKVMFLGLMLYSIILVSLGIIADAVFAQEMEKPKCNPVSGIFPICDFIQNRIPLFVASIVNPRGYDSTLHNYIIERQREHFVLLESMKTGGITAREFAVLSSTLMKDYNEKILSFKTNSTETLNHINDYSSRAQQKITEIKQNSVVARELERFPIELPRGVGR